MDDPLLQNATTVLLQNATKVYYKMRQFYYKMRVIKNCDDFITKCDSHYKMRRLLQIATVQTEKANTCCIKRALFFKNHVMQIKNLWRDNYFNMKT